MVRDASLFIIPPAAVESVESDVEIEFIVEFFNVPLFDSSVQGLIFTIVLSRLA